MRNPAPTDQDAGGVARSLVDVMRAHRIEFAPGLTADETRRVEAMFGFAFPPDLAALLQSGLPLHVDGGKPGVFVDWRTCLKSARARAEVDARLAWPVDGMLFDIENDGFWRDSCGARPDTASDREKVCRAQMRRVPVLIPVFAHRYLPASPCEPDNPVFSVYQTDIIIYGNNLPDYLWREFGCEPPPGTRADQAKPIDFWTSLL